jgi:hypothetical protein
MMNSDRDKAMRDVRRYQLKDGLRQILEQTLDERIDRYVEIDQQGIIGDHHFAAASSECVDLYRDGYFISAVMVSQAVNEGILKFIAGRNHILQNNHQQFMEEIVSKSVISRSCADASERIWRSFRNDVHHMNPKVSSILFKQLAEQNLQALAEIEKEIFGVDIVEGRLLPRQPLYWDVQKDGMVPVFLRLGI